jgi:flavodoxin short chain
MSKAIIVYGSTTGNTAYAAGIIEKTLKERQYEVDIVDAADIEAADIGQDYDLVFLGSSTWGDVEDELQEDMVHIYESLDEADLDRKKFAAFGCGDKTYENFCAAVDLLLERAESLGALVLGDGLKIDGDPRDSEEEIEEWAEELLDSGGDVGLQTP